MMKSAIVGGRRFGIPAGLSSLCGIALASGCMLAMDDALAFKLNFGEWEGSFDTTLTYGVQMRMEDRDCRLIGRDNGGCASVNAQLPEATEDSFFLNADNGDLNYDRHDIVSQAVKGTHELFLKNHDGWSGFVRFTELYDFSIDDTRRTELKSEAKDLAMRNFQMLDLYVSKELEVFDHDARIRVGNQVISWGESTFVLGGINYTNSIDVRRAHVPGTQLKEIFRPAPMVSINMNLTPVLGFEGYWQWHWNSFQLDPVGTYFSSADIVGKGNDDALFIPTSSINPALAADPTASALIGLGLIRLLPTRTLGDPGGTGLTTTQIESTASMGPRIRDGLTTSNPLSPVAVAAVMAATPALNTGTAIPLISDGGPDSKKQYGLSLRYTPDWIDSSFGFYYLNYSEKIPFLTYVVDPAFAANNPLSAGVKVEYPENRRLFGVSSSFSAGDWAIGSEISYRPREAAAIDPSVPSGNNPDSAKYACANGGGEAAGKYCRGWVDMKKWQTQATALQIMSPTSGIGRWILPFLGAGEGIFLIEGGVTYFPDLERFGGIPWSLPAYSVPDKVSAGYVLEGLVTYPNAFNSGFNWTPQIDWSQGVKGNSPNSIPWQQGVKAGTFSLNLNRQNRITGSLAYTTYFGGGTKNLYRDRDFLGASVGYNF